MKKYKFKFGLEKDRYLDEVTSIPNLEYYGRVLKNDSGKNGSFIYAVQKRLEYLKMQELFAVTETTLFSDYRYKQCLAAKRDNNDIEARRLLSELYADYPEEFSKWEAK